MFKATFNHIKSFRQWYIWVPLFLLAPYILGKIAIFLNHGKPLLDDPSSVYGNALEWVPVNIALIVTATYSGFLNNSLTPEQYATASWKDKLVDNLPELIVFIIVLIHLHLHS